VKLKFGFFAGFAPKSLSFEIAIAVKTAETAVGSADFAGSCYHRQKTNYKAFLLACFSTSYLQTPSYINCISFIYVFCFSFFFLTYIFHS
jgi:hypothetical protein